MPSTSSRPTTRRRSFSGSANVNQYEHEVLEIARVVRVVKGGRRFRFRASVVVGDKNGSVGFGVAKSRDVQTAIQKAQAQAEKTIVKVKVVDGTIAHEIHVTYKGAKLMMKPARPGTGVIAGGTVRMVADLAGVKDLVAKRYGSANRVSNARATIKGLLAL